MTAPPAEAAGLDVLLLAGGTGARLGGCDKAELQVGGVRLIDRVLDAVAPVETTGGGVVVVGPERPLGPGHHRLTWAREDPPGGGPLAATAAGLAHACAPFVAVLAVDLPFVSWTAVRHLLLALRQREHAAGALYVDAGGRDQLLFGVWRTSRLRAAMPADASGGSLRSVVNDLDIVRLPAGEGVDVLDCDTDADLQLARHRAGPAEAGSTGSPG